MHPLIDQYIEFLHTMRCAPATMKIIRENQATEVKGVPTELLEPRSLTARAINALRAVATLQNAILLVTSIHNFKL